MVDRRRVALLAIAAVGAAIVALTAIPALSIVPFGSALLGINAEFTPTLLAEDLAAGLTLCAAGLIAWMRQPANPIWRLMVASYFADFIWQLAFIPISALWTASILFSFLDAAIFAHLVLAFPTGHIRSVSERRLVMAIYGYAVGISLVRLFFFDPTFACDPYCPRNLLLIWPDNGVASTFEAVANLSVPIIAIALAILFWRHWRSASPPSRRAMRPLALAFPLLLAVLAPIYVAYELGLDAIVEIVLNPWVWVIDFVLPVAFFTGALRLRLTRGSVATAMLELGALPTPARLQEMLRRRLGDSSIVVLRWSEAQRAYVDADGRIVDEPPSGTSQALTALERDGHPIGAVLHDSALLDDPAVGNTIRHAASLVMDATEVRDQLHARGGQTDGLPSGEVTFLFADVEQSTALLESLGSTYGTVMDELRRIASEAAERNGGQLVDARGDEVFLAFPSAEGGVKTALEITNRLDRAAWPQGVVLRVRIGLHTGRPELTRSGYVGIDVHRAARIMATAGGGQIVASAAVMAKMPATDGLNVRPLGHYELRGIAERVEIVAIEDAGPLGPAAR